MECRHADRCWISGSPLEEFTTQLHKPINCISPTGLDLELLDGPLKITPRVPVDLVPGAS